MVNKLLHLMLIRHTVCFFQASSTAAYCGRRYDRTFERQVTKSRDDFSKCLLLSQRLTWLQLKIENAA